ncbi:hypothetical protein C5167_019808 [Papaver somniferum]|uniref:PGG domain-containing protein n=2 Tax=Papaver somniferum TaxID=3469 RepID=A0A4Y7IV59_PAPSO|nr:hypothetical protein C5167_019808 [Papaver somniferum]
MLAESQAKLVETQAKQAELQADQEKSQAKLAETQANIQQQIIDILRPSTNDTAGNNNHHTQQQEDTANNARQEITHVLNVNNDGEQKDGCRATFVFGKNNHIFEALRDRDLEKAKEYLKKNPEVINEAICEDLSTILHKAVYLNIEITFLKEIVELMKPDILEYKTNFHCGGDNAVHIAAFRGYTQAVVTMVSKNSKLAQIRNDDGYTPLEIALLYVTPGQKAIVEFLYSVTKDVDPSPFSGSDGAKLLWYAIDADFYDFASSLVKRFPQLITEISLTKNVVLELFVRKSLAFRSGTRLTWWQKRVYSLIQLEGTKVSSTTDKRIPVPYLTRVSYIMNVYKHKLMHKQAIALLKQMLVGLKNANNLDNCKGVSQAVRFPGMVQHRDQKMIEMAIAEKNVEIVNLICDCGDVEFEDKITLLSVMDNNDNTILHHAAKLAPSAKLNMISGVALQIQRELQWFKGVERMLKINYKDKRNKEGYTARSIFTKEHKELVKEGEQWMKDTSGSCMLVAALIATVAFAAAFTVPGGNISDSHSSKNGTPVFLGKTSFTVFAVADSFALFSSITSVLMFLAVYTSRYAEMDFLKSLPQKVIIGLTTLFISMAAILVAFCASIFIVIGDMSPQSLILIGLFGCVPVTLFAWLQLPLFYEMVQSTYWGDHFEKHKYIDPRVEKIITKRKRV